MEQGDQISDMVKEDMEGGFKKLHKMNRGYKETTTRVHQLLEYMGIEKMDIQDEDGDGLAVEMRI